MGKFATPPKAYTAEENLNIIIAFLERRSFDGLAASTGRTELNIIKKFLKVKSEEVKWNQTYEKKLTRLIICGTRLTIGITSPMRIFSPIWTWLSRAETAFNSLFEAFFFLLLGSLFEISFRTWNRSNTTLRQTEGYKAF